MRVVALAPALASRSAAFTRVSARLNAIAASAHAVPMTNARMNVTTFVFVRDRLKSSVVIPRRRYVKLARARSARCWTSRATEVVVDRRMRTRERVGVG